jgi:hypothetical protein
MNCPTNLLHHWERGPLRLLNLVKVGVIVEKKTINWSSGMVRERLRSTGLDLAIRVESASGNTSTHGGELA